MRGEEFIFWVTQPPGMVALDLLEAAADRAEPLLDLRYGTAAYRRSLVERAVQADLLGLTVLADSRDASLLEFLLGVMPRDARLILTSVGPDDDALSKLLKTIHERGLVVGVEVGSADDVLRTTALGADFLVASGNEAYGPVSAKNSLVLIQELMDGLTIPLVVRGSLGPQGAAAAMAAGCAGCILDSQLLLVDDSPLKDEQKETLRHLGPADTSIVGALAGCPYRQLSVGARDEYQALVEKEHEILLAEGSEEEHARRFEEALEPILTAGFSGATALLPVGQGLVFAQQFAEDELGVEAILDVYASAVRDSVSQVISDFPLIPDGPLAQQHNVTYPVVQGPMAFVTGNPRMAAEVARNGALPFVAAGGLSPEKTTQLLKDTRSALEERPFGVGIIAFSPVERIEEQLKAVLADSPDFVVIAGGDPDIARRFDEGGVEPYLHTPSLATIRNALDQGVRGIILEGHEAGGHVGALGSLVLWELAVREVTRREEGATSSLRVLFAGGIGNARSALMAATLAAPLTARNVPFGLQLGTAYLTTKEAVESGAIPAKYRKALLTTFETSLTGQSVNLPARWLRTPSVHSLTEAEARLVSEGVSLPERKKQVEKLNHECLVSSLTEGEEEHPPAYMCGQMVAIQQPSMGMADLHRELTEGAAKLAESCSIPDAREEGLEDVVAIIGMGCVVPGADSIEKYWDNIINRRSQVQEVPKELWDPELCFDPERGVPDKTYSKIGAFIQDFKKDPMKFRVPPVMEPHIDKLQFLALEVAHQALEDAGCLESGFPKERTGVFIGQSGSGRLGSAYGLRASWARIGATLHEALEPMDLSESVKESVLDKMEELFKEHTPEITADALGGSIPSLTAGRVANCFDLGGRSTVLDCACASSLAALSVGVTELVEGRLDLALVGGVDMRVDAGSYISFSALGAISAKDSHPFDERADGFVLGEGAGMVLLKRAKDAIRDGDRIYALVRGVGSSSDGRVKGITAPDVNGQIRCLRRAWNSLPFTPDTLSFVEAHGTGTWVGDITEVTSLTQFLRQYTTRKQFIGLTTVKSMIGHLKAAAGAVSLIKAALALHRGILPPTMNCEQPRQEVDWDNSPFRVITEPEPFERKGSVPRRAAVDSFGFGGINFHAVLEEAPDRGGEAADVSGPGVLPAELIVFRAENRGELLRQVESAKKSLDQSSDIDMRQLAFSLLEEAPSTGPTLAIVASDVEAFGARLEKALDILRDDSRAEFTSAQGIYFGLEPLGPDEKVAFLFPGQGTLFVNMAGDLPVCFPFVDGVLRIVDNISRRYLSESILPVLSTGGEISKEEHARLAEKLANPLYNHPIMLASGLSILEVLARAGVRPDMVVGHSMGEYLALQAAGVFDRNTASDVISARGREITRQGQGESGMAAVSASAEFIEPYLKEAPGFVVVANRNCPAQTVISGEIPALEHVLEKLKEKEIPCQLLRVNYAFHTSFLDHSVEPLRKFLEKTEVHKPTVPVQCNLTGRFYETEGDFAAHLRDALARHLTRPVEFISNTLSMYEAGARLFVEVGPGSTISSFVDSTLADKPHWTIPTNLPRRSATLQLLHALGFCAARGLPVDIRGILETDQRKTLKRARRKDVVRPQIRQAPAKTKAGATPDLVSEALSGKSAGEVEAYLKARGDFLKDMVRLDFQHLSGSPAPSEEDDDLKQRVVGLISRKTGYPADVIDIDLDVEAELGMDSIKQAEVIRELAAELSIDFGGDSRGAQYRITTPRKLIETARSLVSGSAGAAKAKSTEADGQPSAEAGGEETAEEEDGTDCHRWVCRRTETPLSEAASPEALSGSKVLLLAREDGPGDCLKGRLEEAGAQVSVIRPSFEDGAIPDEFDVILDLWSFGEDHSPTLEEIEDWWRGIGDRSDAILRVCQRVSAALREDEAREVLWVEVTSLGGALGADAISTAPSRAGAALGMTRGLYHEFRDRMEGLYLDFSPEESEERVAAHVLDELTHEREYSEIGYADHKRFVIDWITDDLEDAQPQHQLGSDSVVLAVGGARGVTAVICQKLAIETKARIVVVGRSPEPPDDAEEGGAPSSFDEVRDALIEELRQQGKAIVPTEVTRLAWGRVWAAERARNMRILKASATQATYEQCDISDAGAASELVKKVWQAYGRIDLVIQGGATISAIAVRDCTREHLIETMKSKALGTACLLAALSNVEVGTFINFSTNGGRWGGPGQGAYGAGHEVASVLLAAARANRPGRWINTHFGAWLDIGMMRMGESMSRMRAMRANFITEEAGGAYFLKEFACGEEKSVAFCGVDAVRTYGGGRALQRAMPRRAPVLDHARSVLQVHVEAGKLIDLARHRYVGDHFVGYEHPVIPGMVSLELMAQTAALLADPRSTVTRIEDIYFPRAARFPRGEPREFQMRAFLRGRDKKEEVIYAELYSLFTPPGSEESTETVHAYCTIRFGQREPASAPSLLVVGTGFGDCRVDAAPFWETKARERRLGMFQNTESFSSITRDGAVGEVRGFDVPDFGGPPLTVDPIRNDGCFDLLVPVAYVALERAVSFIDGAKSIEFFATDDAANVRAARSRVVEAEKTLEFDVEAMDDSGRVAERLTGARLVLSDAGVSAELSEPIWDACRENPVVTKIRQLLGSTNRFTLAQVPISLVKSCVESDEEALLAEQLSAEERAHYESLSVPKRRFEWLAGRIVAKAAVRMLLHADAPAPANIHIPRSEDGAPGVVMPEGTEGTPQVSIAHSHDVAVAIASHTPGFGIDVEKVGDTIREIASKFGTEDEQGQMNGLVDGDETIGLTSLWAVKEAGLKAIGPEKCSMRALALENSEAKGDTVVCELGSTDVGRVRAVTFESDGYVYAVGRSLQSSEGEV